MPDVVLTLNAGSSSLKASLFEVGDRVPILALKADVDGIGVSPRFRGRDRSGGLLDEHAWPGPDTPFETLLETVLRWAEAHMGPGALSGVGHRVVHGGREHVGPEPVTSDLLSQLDRLVPLAPLHEPHNLLPIRMIAASRPDLPQVACFDTAFHATMAPVATRLGIPRAYEAQGVRRYGFHGLSYEHIARTLSEVAPDLAAGRVIVAHLGAGASLCAMAGGRSVDTTMSFTPLDGLVMATRSGSLDPGVIFYLQREGKLTAGEVEALLYSHSGLLGVSGLSGDMRTLLASVDPRAVEAIDLFVYRTVREVGAMAGVLGGLDGIVFTAGIGERSAEIRSRICDRLAWLGVALDDAANQANAPLVSATSSRVTVRIIPANEELVIARHTQEVIRARQGP